MLLGLGAPPRGALESLRPSSPEDEDDGAAVLAREWPGNMPMLCDVWTGWLGGGRTKPRFWLPVAHLGWHSSGQAASRISASRLCALLLLLGRRLTRRSSSVILLRKLQLWWGTSRSLVKLVADVLAGGEGGRLQLRHTSGSAVVAAGLLAVAPPVPCRIAHAFPPSSLFFPFRCLLLSSVCEQAQYVPSPWMLTASLQPRIHSALPPWFRLGRSCCRVASQSVCGECCGLDSGAFCSSGCCVCGA